MNPVIMREQLVDQLKTQVTDLERYIQYLHEKQVGLKCVKNSNGDCTCDCPLHGNSQTGIENYNEFVARGRKKAGVKYGSDANPEDAAKIMKRVVTLLQMITFAQFGCNSPQMNRFDQRNRSKKNAKGTHWGDLKAKFELAVEKIVEIDRGMSCNDSDYTSESDDNVFTAGDSERMTAAVRKDLAPALKELLEHGIVPAPSEHRSLIVSHLLDWTCFSTRNASSSPTKMTAWDLLVRYYYFKVSIFYYII